MTVSTTVVSGGNAAGLFPEITPAPTPSPGPEGTNPAAAGSVSPAAGETVGVITSATAPPVLALIALVVAFLLLITPRSRRRRSKGRGPGA